MKKIIIQAVVIISALAVISCKRADQSSVISKKLLYDFENGEFKKLRILKDSLASFPASGQELLALSDSLTDISERIRLDFSLSADEIIKRLKNNTSDLSNENLNNWEAKGWLEYRMIDGEKRYFNRAASNLMLLRRFYEDHDNWLKIIAEDPRMKDRKSHSETITELSGRGNSPVLPVKMKINYTLTVNSDAVPEGETIRCWLPYPRGDEQRQSKPRLISASENYFLISDDSCVHRTIYMEKKKEANIPAVFNVSFIYTSSGQHFSYDGITALPYDKTSDFFHEYTSEQLPQINFSEEVKKLADSLTLPGDDPKSIVRKIYMWFKGNVPWTGALEYSTLPDIPGYVISNRRGDCGMQTFLLMSLLRYKGIPVKWQSGWMVPPGDENLHDWCEVWFEGTGWVPVDVSYDLQASDRKEIREFYLSGIDSYRMIINKGIAGNLYPAKKYARSEPFDFQRGEVEWSGGNLYFDKWDYEMEIEYLSDIK